MTRSFVCTRTRSFCCGATAHGACVLDICAFLSTPRPNPPPYPKEESVLQKLLRRIMNG